ncbi:MAG: tetratricopeptide repeat protein [Chloroflexi bacterium]|nr:tetratricopeptide repeat protein [Chloroflexota bacterium]
MRRVIIFGAVLAAFFILSISACARKGNEGAKAVVPLKTAVPAGSHAGTSKAAMDYFGAANEAENRKDLVSAEKLMKKALELDPDNENFHFALGHIYDGQYRLEEAAEQFKEGFRINPDSAQSHEAFGMILFEQGKLAQSEEEMKKVLKINPGYARAYETLGNLALKQGREKEAEEYFLRAIKCDPDLVDPYIRLGTLYGSRREFKKGMNSLRKGLEANKRQINKGLSSAGGEEGHIRIVMAHLYFESGEIKKAYDEYRKALEVTPNLIGAFTGLAETSYKLGKPGEALAWLQRAQRLYPQEKRPYILEAEISMDGSRPKKAIEILEKLRKTQPEKSDLVTDSDLMRILADAYLKVGEVDKSEPLYLEALKIRPDYLQARYGLARIFARKGDLKDSMKELEKAATEERSFLKDAQEEKDFAKVRSMPEFKKLVKKIENED